MTLLSTVVAVSVVYFVLLHECCTVVANGNDKGTDPPGNDRDRCDECCDKVYVLSIILESVVARLEKYGQALDEVKSHVTRSIPLLLEKQTLAIEELKATLPRGANSSQLDKQAIALDDLKAAVVGIASQLEIQTLLQERQSVSIENVTSQFRRQDRFLDEVKTAVASVFVEERKLMEDLAIHDFRLVEHDQGEKSHKGLVKEIHDALLGPRDCNDVATDRNTSGVYPILIGNANKRREVDVFCDFSTPGGDWLVFQRRKDGTVNFERTWKEYESGFGAPSGEFWLGNRMLHLLTSTRKYKLRIELGDFDGQKRFAEFTTFFVASATHYYRLTVDGYSGNAGDSLSMHSGKKFSTKDVDNDDLSTGSCSLKHRGSWWYGNCHSSNLNGAYLSGPHSSDGDGIEWLTWLGNHYSLKTTEMKISAFD